MARNPQLLFDIEAAQDSVRRLIADTQNVVSRKPLKLNLAVDARGLDDVNKGLGRLSGRADEFTKSLEAANARVLAFGASVSVIAAIERGFTNLIRTTIEVEAAFKRISVIGDQFRDIEKFGRGVFEVAKRTGQGFKVASDAALELARQGLGPVETLERLEGALTLTRLSGIDSADAVRGLTATLNAFKKEGLDAATAIDRLIALDNAFAVSAGDLIEGFSRSASVAQQSGVTFKELAATITVLEEITARGGKNIGNAFKSISERILRPASLKALQERGIKIFDDDKNVLSSIELVDALAQKFNELGSSLTQTAKVDIARTIAGNFQINQFLALVDGLQQVGDATNQYRKALKEQENAAGTAARANEILNNSLEAQIQALKTTLTEAGSLLGNITIAPVLKTLVGELKGFGQFISDELSASGPNVTKALTSIFGDALLVAGAAAALAVGGIIRRFAVFAKDSVSTVLGINAAAKNQEAIQISILNTLRTRGDLEAQLLRVGSNQVAQAQALRNLYAQIAAEDARRIALAKNAAVALAPTFTVGSAGIPVPKRGIGGNRAAGGFVPDLVTAEFNDVKRGVGGAPSNSGIILLNNFPMGGGKKGPMVVNSSEGIMPMENGGAAVLNRNMLDKLGYGQRAAQGSFSLQDTPVAAKSGKFISIKKLESVVDAAIQTLNQQNAVGLEFTNGIKRAIKDANFDLTGKSLNEISKTATSYSKTLKANEAAAKEAYETTLRENAQRKKAFQDNLEIERKKKIAEEQRFKDFLNRSANVQRLPPPTSVGAPIDPLTLAINSNAQNERARLEELAKINSLRNTARVTSDPLSRAAILGQIGEGGPSFPGTSTLGSGNPLALSRSVTRLPGGILTNPLGSYQPIRGAAQATDPLTRATQIGTERFLSSIQNQPRGLSNVAQNQAIFGRTSGATGASFGATQRLAAEQVKLADATSKVTKSFSTAATEFGVQFGSIFLGASAAKEALSLFGVEINKTIDTVRDLAIAYVAIKKLGELGGANIGSLTGLFKGRGGAFGKGFSAGRSGLGSSAVELLAGGSRGAKAGAFIGSLAGGLARLGPALLGLLPIVGQFGVALFAANSLLKAFGIDAVASINRLFGGLDESGKRAKDSLEKFSESMFEGSKFVGISRDEASRNLSARIAAIQERQRAETLKTDTAGKTDEQIAAENFRKELSGALKGLKIGGGLLEETTLSVGPLGESITERTGKLRSRTFSDLEESRRKEVEDALSQVFALNEKELTSFAKSKNVPVDVKDGIQELRIKVAKAVFDSIGNIVGETSGAKQGELILNKAVRGIIDPSGVARERVLRESPNTIEPRAAQLQIQNALELRRLQLDFTTAQERSLDLRLRTQQLTETEKADLQVQLNNLTQEREERKRIFDIVASSVDKLKDAEGFQITPIIAEDFKKTIQSLLELGQLSPEQALGKYSQFLSELKVGDSTSIDEQQGALDLRLQGEIANTEEKRKQNKLINEAVKEEARLNQTLRERRQLLQSGGEFRLSQLDVRDSTLQAEIARIQALSANPNVGTRGQESFRREEIDLQIQSLRLQQERAEQIRRNAEAATRENPEFKNTVLLSTELAKIQNEFDKTTNSINGQIAALEIQKKAVGGVAEAFVLLDDKLYQFKQGLNELQSSNDFDILQAGDLNSLVSGLTRGQALSDLFGSKAEGKDAVKLLSERTAIRQKEAEIALSTSNSQKLQLEQELALLRDVFRIRKEGGTQEEQILKLVEAQNRRLKEQRSFAAGARGARAEIQDNIEQFSGEFGRTATLGFRDAISEALKAAANNTGDLRNALLDVALAFANKLRDAALDNLANIITNRTTGDGRAVSGALKFLGGLFGGGVQAKASGGKVTGGSGTKDDVPTLLMGGEYIINKRSVQKYGPQFFEALNNGNVGGMANGGMFIPGMFGQGAIRGAGNLRRFAGQQQTAGRNDQILDLGGGALVALEPESFRLSNFARQADNPINQAIRETKEQALGLFFEDQNLQQQYKDQLRAQEKAEKDKIKQLLVSLAIAAVGGVASGAFGGGAGAASSITGGGRMVSERPAGLPSSTVTAPVISNRAIIRSSSSATNLSPGVTRAVNSSSLPSGDFDVNTFDNPLLPKLRNAGGMVPGRGYGDTVPTLMTGGEGVLNRRAMKYLGPQNLNAINTGASIGTSEEKSEELNNRLIAKLEEIVEKVSSQGNITINVADMNGQASASEMGNANEDRKNMARRIKDEVLRIMQEEKRLGGVLRK